MLFHSVQFLAMLSVTFALYWAVRLYKWPRLIVLMVASLVFYVAWNPLPLLIFAFYGAVNVVCGRVMRHINEKGPRTLVMAAAVTLHLGTLCVFKYLDLFIGTTAWMLQKVGLDYQPQKLGLLLPVGLSFITFKAISYIVDVYRGELHGRHSVFDQALYLLFFPHVVAGPIVRARDLLSRFYETPRLKPEDGARALYRIATGLGKKLLLGDVLAVGIIAPVFSMPQSYTAAECAFAAVAYTIQIYFDFSAYSDIAIGVSGLFGFQIPENFNKPFHARNVAEFWNRWHLSLSNWLRDYLYVPLGGNRRGRLIELRNITAVMVLGGLWHGADWRFALWGAIHAVLLCAARIKWWWFGKPRYTPLTAAIGIATTFTLVALTRIFFRADDIGKAMEMFQQLGQLTWGLANVSTEVWLALIASVVLYCLPPQVFELGNTYFFKLPIPARAGVLVVFALVIKQVANFEAQPYIYFKF
jgi:alginate O-acetyltransferase complex protein AlgI